MPAVKQQMFDLFFPISGIAVDVALEQQTPDTTPIGINVRAFEPLTQRARGGSRSGISKYLLPQVPPWSVGKPIQLLGIVIDPQASALGVSYPPGGGGYSPLILTNANAVIYGGGSGFAPSIPSNLLIITANNQNKKQGTAFGFTGHQFSSSGLQSGDTINFCDFQCAGAPRSASNGKYPIYCSNANISYGGGHTGPPYYCLYAPGTMNVASTPTFVQDGSFSTQAPSSSVTFSSFFTNNVAAGDLIVVCVVTGDYANSPYTPSIPLVTGITDGYGNPLGQVGSNVSGNAASTLSEGQTVAMWYYDAPTDGPLTLNLSLSNTGGSTAKFLECSVLEFALLAASPLDQTTFNVNSITNSTANSLTAGGLSVSAKELVVALLACKGPLLFGLYTVGSPYTFRNGGGIVFSQYWVSTSAGSTSPGGTLNTGLTGDWPAICASFTPA